jgi:hypothetical protein
MAAKSTRKRCALGVVCGGAFWAAAVSCARDERELQLVVPGPGQGSPEMQVGMLQGAKMEIQPPSVALGAVTTGFASRARLKVLNSGTTPLPAPGVAWAAGDAADYELIQNQCSTDLPPGGSCELRVQLVPSHAGLIEAALEVSSGAGNSVRVPFSGEGFAAGNLILAPVVGSFEDFGGVRVGSVRESSFSILNPGTAPSGVLSFRLNRPEFSLPSPQPGECVSGATDLGAGQTCNLRVAFGPAERGPLETTLTATTPGAGSVSLNLVGNGLIAGVLESSVSDVDFAGVVLGSSGFSSVRFENQGDEPMALGGVRLEPALPEFSIQNSTCAAGSTLPAGAACEVGLEFRPTVQDEERSTELVLDAAGLEPLRVGLVGHGLEKGSLLVAATLPGEEDFGDVLLEESVTHVFQVSNPGAQPSGVLSLAVSGAFELSSAPEAADCVDGATSLVNGEGCTVRLSFKPTLRQAESGALTIGSALAGATRLDLKGRGILPAKFELGGEVNFGRVLINASAERTVTLKNAGDQLLPPPSVEVTSSNAAQAAAFSVANGCTAPLAFGEQCALTITFDPTVAVPHSANLQLSAEPGGTASVLLLGEALTPGSLVLAPVNGSTDFGDVPLGMSVSRSFTLSNPGNVASGQLTISSDDTHFLISPGDCNQGTPEGLVDGSSCTFSVAFTPDGSAPVEGNVSVQSPGAGRSGIAIRGRGRSLAALTATGTRDLGRANIGRQATAANQFTWTVTNNGDLPSGTLRVTRGSVTEFQISADTCSNAQVPGHSTCQMQISFVPAEPPGARTENVIATDPASGRAVTLALTAVSVRVANPGQSCINAECASGVCTDGVCCDRACDRTCQQCSATGVCVDQVSQQQCGNGAARCFGVDQCLLPAGQACGANTDCGGGALCKQCLGGGRQCTAPATCCGGCPGNQDCVNGSCGCSAQEIDCGGGLCIPRNTANVCCPSSPSCPTNLPACTADGRCVQCTSNAQCGPCSTCNIATNTCTPRTRGTTGVCPQAGQVCDGNGGCFAPQCGVTGAPACGDCRTCQDFTCRAGNENAVCQGNGQCVAGTCRPGPGRACTAGGTPCANNLPCTNGTCSLPTVGNTAACGPTVANCNTTLGLQCNGGTCGCGPNRTFARGQCRVSNGQECPSNGGAGCADGNCTEWLVDLDGDGWGSFGEAIGGVDSRFICGVASVENEPAPFQGPGCRGGTFEVRFVPRNHPDDGDQDPTNNDDLDCCDLYYACGFVGFSPNQSPSSQFFPRQGEPGSGFATGPQVTINGVAVPNSCPLPQDRNCDGEVVPAAVAGSTGPSPCTQPRCAEQFNKGQCATASAANCSQQSGSSGSEACGPVGITICGVSTPGGPCAQVSGTQITVLCL